MPSKDNHDSAAPLPMSRRRFIHTATRMGLAGIGSALFSHDVWAGRLADSSTEKLFQTAPVARYWISSNAPDVDCTACHLPDADISKDATKAHGRGIVKCLLCANECMIPPGERGRCRTRFNDDGLLKSLVYGRPVAVHVDPIEKKPFYHYLPGSNAFSLATAGCPLQCKFCQNWEISQARPEDFSGDIVSFRNIVASARKKAAIIAFTYNEPTVFTEYLTDIARFSRTEGLKNVLVSCGFMTQAPLTEMCEVLDAIKIDLKGFSTAFYRKFCDAELAPVLRSITQVAKSGVHLEIVNLVVPTLNDSSPMLTNLVDWILGEVGPDVPVHFTRFHPDYRMLNLPPTPLDTLVRAYEIAREKGLRYPYIGNWPGHPGNHTYCPKCGEIVIRRTGFFVTEILMEQGLCRKCKQPIAGVWRR